LPLMRMRRPPQHRTGRVDEAAGDRVEGGPNLGLVRSPMLTRTVPSLMGMRSPPSGVEAN